MKICVKCRLCQKWAFSTTKISLHLKTIYRDSQAEWFEPTPLLEGDKEEVMYQVLAANFKEIEDIKADPDEEQDE